MSTELKSRTSTVNLNRFWGGYRKGGVCIQLTKRREDGERTIADEFYDSIQLTREEALTLARDLLDFAYEDEQELIDPYDDRDFQTFWEMGPNGR